MTKKNFFGCSKPACRCFHASAERYSDITTPMAKRPHVDGLKDN